MEVPLNSPDNHIVLDDRFHMNVARNLWAGVDAVEVQKSGASDHDKFELPNYLKEPYEYHCTS